MSGNSDGVDDACDNTSSNTDISEIILERLQNPGRRGLFKGAGAARMAGTSRICNDLCAAKSAGPPTGTQRFPSSAGGCSQRHNSTAAKAPAHCAAMNPGASTGRMPAKVSLAARASVTAGLANEVDAVNQ